MTIRNKGIFKYSTLVFGTLFMGVMLPLHPSRIAYGMENPVDKYSPSPEAFKHFEEDKGLMQECLSQVKEAELHFFWTTGRTLSDNPEYHPNTKVDVGGAEYGQKFFPYVDKLLETAPKNLKIKFVCDGMTEISNQKEIEALEEKYKNRFHVLPITVVQERLLKAFPTQHEKINLIFKNAT